MSEIQGVASPDTQPDKAIRLPIPESLDSTLQDVSDGPKPPALPSLKTLKNWAPLYLQKTDRTISHINRILSTASGTDTLLMTICYTSLLTSTLLKTLTLARLRHTVRQIIEKAISLPPDTTILIPASSLSIQTSKALLVSARLKKFSDLISDFRIFVRVWGLLGIWAWGKSVFLGGKEGDDGIVKGIGYAQVAVNIFYQYLENGAYLSSKGVLGWSTEKQNKAWLWSSRFWMAHVGLDFVRLGREIVLRRNKQKTDAAGEKDDGAAAMEDEGKWRAKWRREMVVNLAYAPLTIHWSLEEGLVGDFWVGLLGSVAGITGFRELWKNTGGL